MSDPNTKGIMRYFTLFVRWIDRYTWRFVLSLLLIAASVIMVWEPSWFVSAIDSLRIPYALFLVVFIMFFFLRSNYALATAGGIAFAIIAPGLWPYFKTANETPAQLQHERKIALQDAEFTVLHFNVKENNKRIASVAEAAVQTKATVVSLQEIRPANFPIVDSIMRHTYPYVYSELNYPGFGMAIYARSPLLSAKTEQRNGYPVIHCTIQVQDDTIHLFAATTSTPTNEKDFKRQAQEFIFITECVNAVQAPVLLMGDMNSVPWSEHIESLLKNTKLIDSRKDLAATYPAQSPMQIPIDYILHSKHIECPNFTTVGGTTSNHLGLLGQYIIRHKKDDSGSTKK